MSETANPTGRITEIRDQVRDPERVSVFIDGAFRLGLPRILVAERNLRVGQTLNEDDIAELEALDEVSKATNQAVRLLSFRPRSSRELRIRLRQKDFSDRAIDAALARLEELGYVNDADFAEYWVENRQQNRPRGRRLLASELRAKGVPGEIVQEALDHAEIDEFAEALELARNRSMRLQDLDPEVRRRRLTGFLQRRGYGWDVVRKVLDAVESTDDDE